MSDSEVYGCDNEEECFLTKTKNKKSKVISSDEEDDNKVDEENFKENNDHEEQNDDVNARLESTTPAESSASNEDDIKLLHSPSIKSKTKHSSRLEIYSENQRLIRESKVTLPYHEPKIFKSFREFKETLAMKRRPDYKKLQPPPPPPVEEGSAPLPAEASASVDECKATLSFSTTTSSMPKWKRNLMDWTKVAPPAFKRLGDLDCRRHFQLSQFKDKLSQNMPHKVAPSSTISSDGSTQVLAPGDCSSWKTVNARLIQVIKEKRRLKYQQQCANRKPSQPKKVKKSKKTRELSDDEDEIWNPDRHKDSSADEEDADESVEEEGVDDDAPETDSTIAEDDALEKEIYENGPTLAEQYENTDVDLFQSCSIDLPDTQLALTQNFFSNDASPCDNATQPILSTQTEDSDSCTQIVSFQGCSKSSGGGSTELIKPTLKRLPVSGVDWDISSGDDGEISGTQLLSTTQPLDSTQPLAAQTQIISSNSSSSKEEEDTQIFAKPLLKRLYLPSLEDAAVACVDHPNNNVMMEEEPFLKPTLKRLLNDHHHCQEEEEELKDSLPISLSSVAVKWSQDLFAPLSQPAVSPTAEPSKKRRRVVLLSDDDEEEEEEEENVDDTRSEASTVNIHDDEDNDHLIVKKQFSKKFSLANFVEEEAELSGSEIDEDDDEENYLLAQENLDAYEEEEGDQDGDLPSEGDLRRQLEKVHNHFQRDDDDRQIRILQEMLLPDGDLHDESIPLRKRRFQWANKENEEGPHKLAGWNSDSDDSPESDAQLKQYPPGYMQPASDFFFENNTDHSFTEAEVVPTEGNASRPPQQCAIGPPDLTPCLNQLKARNSFLEKCKKRPLLLESLCRESTSNAILKDKASHMCFVSMQKVTTVQRSRSYFSDQPSKNSIPALAVGPALSKPKESIFKKFL